jgi:hypothetical protein
MATIAVDPPTKLTRLISLAAKALAPVHRRGAGNFQLPAFPPHRQRLILALAVASNAMTSSSKSWGCLFTTPSRNHGLLNGHPLRCWRRRSPASSATRSKRPMIMPVRPSWPHDSRTQKRLQRYDESPAIWTQNPISVRPFGQKPSTPRKSTPLFQM